MPRPGLRLHPGHKLRLLQGSGDYFPALVQAMDAAQRQIRLETYIFDFNGGGAEVAEALVRAGQRGVTTTLVVDGVGTGALPPEWTARFDEAGVKWHVYSPIALLGWLVPRQWRRMHRKLCVVDGQVAFCGGINILDDFFDPNHGKLEHPRFDFAVQVAGPLVAEAQEVTDRMWWRLHERRKLARRESLSQRKAREAQARQAAAHSATQHGGAGAVLPGDRLVRAGLVLRDNFRNRTRIEKSYRKAIASAREEVIIANAYFLPGGKLRKALVLATRRGVKVQLLLQGKYEYFMQYYASRPVYGSLLEAGVEIHEYSPSFLHAKVAVVDGHWATVGSSNLDPLSLLLAREANVVVEDAQFASDLRARLVHAMQHEGQRVDPERYAGRSLKNRIMEYVAFIVVRIGLFVQGKRY